MSRRAWTLVLCAVLLLGACGAAPLMQASARQTPAYRQQIGDGIRDAAVTVRWPISC